MKLSDGKIKHLNALADKRGVIAAAAMDQRGSLRKMIAAGKGVSQNEITDEMMQEFKTAVSKALTPHASAILLDPEYGLPAAKARARNAGLLLAYEESGYDNTKPGAKDPPRALTLTTDLRDADGKLIPLASEHRLVTTLRDTVAGSAFRVYVSIPDVPGGSYALRVRAGSGTGEGEVVTREIPIRVK